MGSEMWIRDSGDTALEGDERIELRPACAAVLDHCAHGGVGFGGGLAQTLQDGAYPVLHLAGKGENDLGVAVDAGPCGAGLLDGAGGGAPRRGRPDLHRARQPQEGVWTGKGMLIWGGVGANGVKLQDTWSYTPGKTMFLYQKQ